jgi:RNA polymerase sigma-70 factor (ECF subfamily)
MPKAPLSDIDLWHAVQQDDEFAFNVLFDRYWKVLYSTACKYSKDRETSEEIVHDVFLNLWNRRKNLEIEIFPNFLLTAIRYQLYNRARAAKLVVVHLKDEVYENLSHEDNYGERNMEEQELKQELYTHLNGLPKRCQEIFCMSRFDNLSNQEIAEKLGISKRTVENQITHALKHLRFCLKGIALYCLLYFPFIK